MSGHTEGASSALWQRQKYLGVPRRCIALEQFHYITTVKFSVSNAVEYGQFIFVSKWNLSLHNLIQQREHFPARDLIVKPFLVNHDALFPQAVIELLRPVFFLVLLDAERC